MDLQEIQKKTLEFVKGLVNNAKDDGEEVDNAKVDKRKLIDEVAAIMKDAGCDDEEIRTAIGKMEKIGYDKSEAGTADNEDKKVKNGDEEDETEYDDLKKEVKKDVDNKCGKKDVKNSVDNGMDYFNKMNEIYNAAQTVKEECVYTSRFDREKAAEEYFKRD